MSRLNPLSWSLSTKILGALALATFAPLILLALLSYNTTTRELQRGATTYLIETNNRRQQIILSNFRLAFREVDRLMADTTLQATLIEALRQRQLRGASASQEAYDAARTVLQSQLVSDEQGLIGEAFLLTRTGFAIVPVRRSGPAIVQTEDLSNTLLFEAARNLTDFSTTGRDLIVSERNGSLRIDIINVLNNNQGATLGYLVTNLNIETLVISQLQADSTAYDAYSFFVLPTNDQVIAPPAVRQSNRISLNSAGMQRAFSRAASQVTTYITGPADQRLTVLGHYVPVNIQGRRFTLVTEVNNDTLVRTSQTITMANFGLPLLLGIFLVISFAVSLTRWLVPPLQSIRSFVASITRGILDVPFQPRPQRDELGELGRALNNMRESLVTHEAEMRQRLLARTRDVRIIQDISRAILAERELQRLLNRVVNLIVQNFPTIYHAQIFLADEMGYAVLRASTGDAGQRLLERGHKLEIGSVSVIGQVLEQGETIVARDTTASDVHRQNEFLPATRAEIAIPLIISQRVIGALDVQSRQRDSFDADLVEVLETLADQVTIAIENVRLFQGAQQGTPIRREERRRQETRAWQAIVGRQALITQAGNPTTTSFTELRQAVWRSGQAIVGELTERGTIPFAVPIRLREQMLGVVKYEIAADDFRYDKVLLAEELVNRLAISLDNARLFQESQQATERERIVNEIAAKISGQTDVESILQTAIQEISLALRTPQVGIHVAIASEDSADGEQSE